MAEAEELQRRLLGRQNGDGGWGYQSAISWAEPTALALLALESCGFTGAAHESGCAWLLRCQRDDGGWSPNPSVAVSTSVTSVAALALSSWPRYGDSYKTALNWVAAHTKKQPGTVERLKFWLQDVPISEATAGGSPWFPGTAAWIAPTAMTVLAFSGNQAFIPYVRRAQSYILSRRCADGGWNHGGNPYRSGGATSYGEMTGIALLALEGIPEPQLSRSLEAAETMSKSPDSSEGQSWLHLALTRHGRYPAPIDRGLPWHTTRDLSLRLLAVTASSPTNRMRVGAARLCAS